MTDRFRSRYNGLVEGSYTYGTTTRYRTRYDNRETCDDVIGSPLVDHPLIITKKTDTYFIAKSGSNGSYTYDNYPLYSYATQTGDYAAPDPPSIETMFTMTDALAQMNPANSKINIPVFLVELREMGQLATGLAKSVDRLKEVGEFIFKSSPKQLIKAVAKTGKMISGASNEYIKYQFGIKPLLSDLVKMTNFSHHLANRMNEYDYLASEEGQRKGLSRRMQLPDFTSEGLLRSKRSLNTAYGIVLRAASQEKLTAKQWVTTRWRPSDAFLEEWRKPYPDRERIAAKQVLGLNANQLVDNVWQALPWSWLSDWLFTGGSYLQATNNCVAHHPTHCCAMRTTTRTAEFSEVEWPTTIEAEGPFWSSITKERTVLVITEPTIAFRPALDARRWSLLGALSIQNGWLKSLRNMF